MAIDTYKAIIALKEEGRDFGLEYASYMSIGNCRTLEAAKEMLDKLKYKELEKIAKTAKQLGYPREAIGDIYDSNSLKQAERILVDCRKGIYKKR